MEKIDYNRLYTLIKSSLMSNYSFINRINKKHKKLLPMIITFLVIAITMVSLYFIGFTKLFKEANLSDTILYMSISLSSILIFFTNLMKVNSYIFRCKDYDLLTSMPLNTKEIVISKLIVLYITSFLFSFIIGLCSYIAYALFEGFNILFLINTILLTFIIPFIPIASSSLIAFVIGYIKINKKTKNVLITIIYFILSLLMILAYINIIKYDENNLIKQVSELKKYFLKMWPLTNFIYNGFYNKSILNLFIYVISSLIILFIYITIVSKYFVKFNSLEKENIQKKTKQNTYRQKNYFVSLLSKELKMYTNIPTFIINTMIGPILSVVCITIMSSFIVRNNYIFGLEKLDQLLLDLNVTVKEFVIGLLGVSINMILTISQISSCSISLEGKSLGITKSLPISKKDIFSSKIIFNYLIFGAFSFISSILVIVILKPVCYVSIILLLLCLLNPLSFSVIGLLCNLYLPKLNYSNPYQVVKQGLSVLANMIVSLVLNIFYLGLFIAITITVNALIGLLCLLVISIITFAISILVLKKESYRFDSL